MASRPSRPTRSLPVAVPVIAVPAAVTVAAVALPVPHLVAFVAMAAGVAWVGNRRGPTAGAYAALLGAAAVDGVLGMDLPAGHRPPGPEVVLAAVVLLACALLGERRGRAKAVTGTPVDPVQPQDPAPGIDAPPAAPSPAGPALVAAAQGS